jgi:hypothetical protein
VQNVVRDRHNLAVGLIVNLRLRPSGRNFRLSGDRCRSLILGFDNQGTSMRLGAVVTTNGNQPLAPGSTHGGAKVQLWSDHPQSL